MSLKLEMQIEVLLNVGNVIVKFHLPEKIESFQ